MQQKNYTNYLKPTKYNILSETSKKYSWTKRYTRPHPSQEKTKEIKINREFTYIQNHVDMEYKITPNA